MTPLHAPRSWRRRRRSKVVTLGSAVWKLRTELAIRTSQSIQNWEMLRARRTRSWHALWFDTITRMGLKQLAGGGRTSRRGRGGACRARGGAYWAYTSKSVLIRWRRWWLWTRSSMCVMHLPLFISPSLFRFLLLALSSLCLLPLLLLFLHGQRQPLLVTDMTVRAGLTGGKRRRGRMLVPLRPSHGVTGAWGLVGWVHSVAGAWGLIPGFVFGAGPGRWRVHVYRVTAT